MKRSEIWRRISDAPMFTISNYGRVQYLPSGEIMELWADDEEGCLVVSLIDEIGNPYLGQVDRLVAETFIPPAEDEMEVEHIDGDPYNNEAWNLQWTHWTEMPYYNCE